MKVEDKVIVITGGANGIGKACTIQLHNANAKIIIADIDEKNGKEIEKRLGERCSFVKTDITNEQEVTYLKNFIMDKYGRIDVLINNAAKQTENSFFDMKVDEFKSVIDTNINGTFICSNILGREMKKGSKIINMLSVHYDRPRKNKYHYDTSKAGIAMLTKEMALTLVDNGITVNGISYGACDTPMNSNWIHDQEKVETTLSKIPLRWIAKPEEIANFVVNILENFTDYTTGSIFNIDGGRSLTN